MTEYKILSIWFFVGLMLTTYGLIITLLGVYFLFHPQHNTALAELNPNLWWGLIMLFFGVVFLIAGIKDFTSLQNEKE